MEPVALPEHTELGKRLVRAYRDHGVVLEVREPPTVGARFLRFAISLGRGQQKRALERAAPDVQHRIHVASAPLVSSIDGRLYVDVPRSDPDVVTFDAIAGQLPPLDPVRGTVNIPIGVDPAGRVHFADLSSSGRSHVLVAGSTGSGKSEWLRMIVAALLASNTPETLRLVTFDPKLAAFNDLERSRFLWRPDAWWIPEKDRPATELLTELVEEMDRRYQRVRAADVDNLGELVSRTGQPTPRIVCLCDEYMAFSSQAERNERIEIERLIALLGAKARAAGIHLVLATQQPSRKVVTATIDANLPCRVALRLQKDIESRIILGAGGAEQLTGSGDLLYKDFGDPVRLQAPYLSAEERQKRLRG